MSNVINELKKLKTKMEMQEFLEEMKLENECMIIEDHHNLTESLGINDAWGNSIPLDNDEMDEYLTNSAARIDKELLFINTDDQSKAETKYKTDKIVQKLKHMQDNIEMFKDDSKDEYLFLMTYYEKSNIYILVYDNRYIIEIDGIEYDDISKVDICLLETIYAALNKCKSKEE